MSDVYQKGNHPDGVRAMCKECERVVLKDSEEEAQTVADNHNQQRHDGDEVAGVVAWDVQSLPEILPNEPSVELIAALSNTLNDMSAEDIRLHIEHKNAREDVGATR